LDILKLSDRECKILSSIQLQADASVSKISKETGCKEHGVRYSISKLFDLEVLARRSIIDLSKMGIFEYPLFFSTTYENSAAEKRLVRAIKKSTKIATTFELGGDFQFGLVICAKDVLDVDETIDYLKKIPGVGIKNQTLGVRLESTLFRRKHLSDHKSTRDYISYARSKEVYKIDAIDKLIISGLSSNKNSSRRELCRKIGLPQSTFEDRLKKLEKNKVLLAHVYGIDLKKTGIQHYRLLIYSRGDNAACYGSLRDFCSKQKNITCLHRCLGPWQFELVAEVSDARDALRISRGINDLFPKRINAIKILPMFNYLKISEFPLIPF